MEWPTASIKMDSSDERFKKITMRGKYFRQLNNDNEDLRREAAAIEHGMNKGADSEDDSQSSTPTNEGSDDAVAQVLASTKGSSKNPFGTISSKRRRNARLLADIHDDPNAGNGSASTPGGATANTSMPTSKNGAAGSSSAAGAAPSSDKKVRRKKGEGKPGATGEKPNGGVRKARSSSRPSVTSPAVGSPEQALAEYSKTASMANGSTSSTTNGSSPRAQAGLKAPTDVEVPISVVQMNLAHLELQDARAKTKDLESRLSRVSNEKRTKEVELATALARIKALELAKSPSKEEIESTKMTARNLQKSIDAYKVEQDELEQLRNAVRNELRAKNGEELVSSSDSEDDDESTSSDSDGDTRDAEGQDADFEEKWLVDTNEVARVLAERRKNQRKKRGGSSSSNIKPPSPRGDVPKKPSLLDGGAPGSSDSVTKKRREKSSSSSAKLAAEQRTVDAIPWFKTYYLQACQTLGVRVLDDLVLVLDRASSKGRRIMELDLNNYNLSSQDIMALARAFSSTSVELAKLDAEISPPVVSNVFDPVAMDLSHNSVTSGRVFVELMMASTTNSVVALDVGFNQWGPKAALEFSEALSSYPHLVTFKCAQNDLGPKAGALLFKALLGCKNLEVLDVSNNALTERVAPALATVITTCPLTTLVIKYNKFKATGVKKIAAAIAMNSTLTELDLTSIGISEKSKEIVDILEARQNLAKLSLGFNKLPSSFIPRFTSFTAKQTKLVHVDLRGLELASKHLRQVIDALAVNCSGTLEELVLNGNVLDAKCMELLIDYVTRTQNLHSIGLRGCALPKKSLIELLGTIKHSTIVKAIDLSGNNFNDRRILDALSSCLQANATLTIMGLAACKIDAKLIGSVGQALQFNKRLEKLHIDGNKLGERGLTEFANGLAGNEVLRVVSIRTCGVSARGLLAFLSVITAKSQVEVLDVGDNNLPNANKAFLDRVAQYDALSVKF